MATRIYKIFNRKPDRWGFRGDVYFWEYLREYFKTHEVDSKEQFIEHVYNQFKEVSGTELTVEAQVYVSRFNHGGISSGGLCGEFWVEKAIPLLCERFDKL